MGRFLRENWIYIVAPVVIVIVILGVVVILSPDDGSPFSYNLW